MAKTVEILTFDGCPNRAPAIELVSRVIEETGVDARVEIVDVPDAETARQTRFLGSPTIRVDGRDIEPGAGERRDYVHSCRVVPHRQRFQRPAGRAVAAGGADRTRS